ncbi:MAG: hypothetical protein WC069_06550 [Candidatus Shapirobacteria bacterium]
MKSAKDWCDEMSQPRSGPLYEHGIEGLVESIQRDALEAALRVCGMWSSPPHLQLHAGEMDTEELRSVRAVVLAVAADIRALTSFRGGSDE